MKTRKITRNLNYKFLSALPLIGIGVFLPQQSGKAMIRRFATSNTAKFFYTSNGARIPIFSSTSNNTRNIQTLQKINLPKTSKSSPNYTNTPNVSSNISVSKSNLESNSNKSITTISSLSASIYKSKNSINDLRYKLLNLESKAKLSPLLNTNPNYYRLYFENDDSNNTSTSNNIVNTHNQSTKINNGVSGNQNNSDSQIDMYANMRPILRNMLDVLSSINQDLDKMSEMVNKIPKK